MESQSQEPQNNIVPLDNAANQESAIAGIIVNLAKTNKGRKELLNVMAHGSAPKVTAPDHYMMSVVRQAIDQSLSDGKAKEFLYANCPGHASNTIKIRLYQVMAWLRSHPLEGYYHEFAKDAEVVINDAKNGLILRKRLNNIVFTTPADVPDKPDLAGVPWKPELLEFIEHSDENPSFVFKRDNLRLTDNHIKYIKELFADLADKFTLVLTKEKIIIVNGKL